MSSQSGFRPSVFAHIPMYKPEFTQYEKTVVTNVLESGWVSEGKMTSKFEEKLAEIAGRKFAITTPNGTSALSLALLSLGVERDQRVIIPDLTFIATANAVSFIGAEPVFVDVTRNSFCLDWMRAKDRKRLLDDTTPILPVDLNGRDSSIDSFHYSHSVYDEAESFGILKSKGRIGCTSFSPQKIVTTIQGGACFTDDERLATLMEEFKVEGRHRENGVESYPHPGFNFKFDDVKAALGLEQLRLLPNRLDKCKGIQKFYADNLPSPIVEPLSRDRPTWTMDIWVPNAEMLQKHLLLRGIETSRTFKPLHLQEAYAISGDFQNSELAYEHMLQLPSYPSLREGQLEHICKLIRRFVD